MPSARSCPATVTLRSCMACNSADWVRGLARLISSAISNWQKIGPCRNRKARFPSASLSSTSLPKISAGIRSGVNCTRLPCSPITVDSVSTSRVLPRPGKPINSPCPPHSSAVRVRSTTVSWPMNRAVIEALASASRCSRFSISATRSGASDMAIDMAKSFLGLYVVFDNISRR